MDTMLVNGLNFQAQLTSIMEMLTKSAVAEIGKLVDDCSTILRLEISQRISENERLRKKCDLLENELRGARVAAARRNPGSFSAAADEVELCGEYRAAEGRPAPAIDNVFGKGWCMSLWRDGEALRAEKDAAVSDEPIELLDDEPDMILIKEETFEDCQVKSNPRRVPRNSERVPQTDGERSTDGLQRYQEEFISYCLPSGDQAGQNMQLTDEPAPSDAAKGGQDSDDCPAFYPAATDSSATPRGYAGKRKFSCVFCGKTFNYLSYLKVHVRRHSGEKPFGCVVCGKRFAQKTYLKLHERTHSGEKPYSCMECGKSFSQKSSLNVHLRSHTGEKPYSCLECGKSYAYKHGFKTHQCVS
ncbi:zinc finger protein with KRAB and SCAN domains 7-like [Denticeps clupeoides]|uniref:zinc finger protein with KRAB and SCAN domains 7-like n=1 Tax=Denticeps clupeoides TaxID=299321 RepID=UPI0010A4F724|nr:zinc finger protein with KRAB and SCAN domains 7-like [Denticeps clupeoides]